ncbi:YhcH/YjgK/YiaL family protein [Undibacterium cyanobacteriorum]|uniref:YhcH/YjgK/YiaL family protein n=1 Tax=Undibacterium cyanobacteriorum TaxID=3073561 RepID=A0ABY9RE35_9BURK|nr:YhcH/YjgK/YiaL family protein [Undibacterium sp. 20NA77.5]WMW79490.1 YhcH/YjgK/YiaL family protein [Undibacterium sp. 20NA77.5]
MILAHISQELDLPMQVAAAIAHLRETDYNNFEIGRHEINERMFALVQDPTTQDWQQGFPEFHRKHIDVQYLLEGEELIGYLPAAPHYEIRQDFLEQRDIAFTSTQVNETQLFLTPGMYAVFFPGELHRPCRCASIPQKIKKVVIKIRVDLNI